MNNNSHKVDFDFSNAKSIDMDIDSNDTVDFSIVVLDDIGFDVSGNNEIDFSTDSGDETIDADIDVKPEAVTGDYEKLNNLPKINGETLIGNLDLTSDIVSHENEEYGEEKNVKEWIDKLLAKVFYTAIAIKKFECVPNAGTFEIGTVIDSVEFIWEYNKEPVSQSLTGFSVDIEDRSAKWETPISANKSFTLSASDGEKSASSSKSFNFLPNIYWGSSLEPTQYDSEWALGLTSKSLKSSIGGNYDFDVKSGEYGYLVMPDKYSFSGTVKIGGFDTELVRVDNISLTNSKGYTQTYKAYRTTNKGLGKFTMVI